MQTIRVKMQLGAFWKSAWKWLWNGYIWIKKGEIHQELDTVESAMTNYDTEIANFSVEHPKMDVFMGVSMPKI